jgi:hypothetical protein
VDLLDFTTPDEVRAALGVSDDELEDTTLALPVYSTNLEAELRDVNVSLISRFQEVSSMPDAQRSDAQSWFLQVTRLFATYVVARQLCTSLPMFSPKEITDGKASVVRFSSDPYQATITMVEEQYRVNQARTRTAFDAAAAVPVQTVFTARTLMATSRGIDPVTGI